MHRSAMFWGLLIWAAIGLLRPDQSEAMEGRSDLALVLAVDASGSIDAKDFTLQLNGIAKAFRQSEVIDAIRSGPAGSIDVALLLWGGDIGETVSSGWFRIGTDGEAAAFAARIAAIPRRAYGTTAVGNAIMAALAMLREVAQRTERLCIDVSGDGKEAVLMRRRRLAVTPVDARARAESLNVTINALAIENEEADLGQWYRRNIVTNDGFVLAIDRIEAFEQAIQTKLIREIRPLVIARTE
jgi:hypothetical protein